MMKTIAFIHQGNAYLPEIEAYTAFFEQNAWRIKLFRTLPTLKDLEGVQVEWHFMGFDALPKVKGRIKIHEYLSGSIPPLGIFKDLYKRYWTGPADLRIFQSKEQRQKLFFNEHTSHLYRGPGLHNIFFQEVESDKPFDFVYLGTMAKARKVEKLLHLLQKLMPEQKVLLIGQASEALKNKFKHHSSFHFMGAVAYEQVPFYLAKAKYAINWMPDKRPYNFQVSYKLLEYCASNLPVISTAYDWVKNFEQENQAAFYYLNHDFSNLDWEKIKAFSFRMPNLKHLNWDRVLEQSGILEWLSEFSG